MPENTERDSRFYREQGRLTRQKAALAPDPDLRRSYTELAESYEKLADTLERAERGNSRS